LIGHLRGKVLVRDAASGRVLLDVGGVGYELTVSLQTIQSVPEPGSSAELWVHTHVREDALALFGFASPREKRMFELLTAVPKVGPRHAMAVLGGFPLDELLACLAEGDAIKLQRIPGIGKKTADQIVLSLRERVEPLAAAAPAASTVTSGLAALREEATAALVQWGWKPQPVAAALDAVLASGAEAPTELSDLLRRATRVLTER
jgi:Holliday junction DNA helicase RuvA